MRRCLGFWLAFCLPTVAGADVIIGSWNIRHLGWNNDKAMAEVAHVASHFDLLAVQELMDPAALERLEARLEGLSGEAWSSMASHALGHGSYREHYGFLWRDGEVAYADGAVVFTDHGDRFSREPYSARFRDRDTREVFTAATVHVVYGDGVADRLPEIEALADYWRWLDEVSPGTPRLLMGDFNLAPTHPAWAPLREAGALPAITRGRTTLGTTPGEYANLYDNLWYDAAHPGPETAGILRFTELLPLSHGEARARVSDHLPVYMTWNGGELVARPRESGVHLAAAGAPGCIDLNASDAEQLARLPHVGAARAAAIVAGRPWGGSAELTRISGIAGGRLAAIEASGLLCGT
ncbi:endonuclease/exonuclease/phosphatase family protein [Halomonas sp. NCCP-2165]|nr:endonuclease/exonuclease/phosphatase family protein [Halomonas sp. NCCP-2165]GKW49629.1 hypothetical protein NCCP2165_18440 [Halomonas sp. NCCP-2165]